MHTSVSVHFGIAKFPFISENRFLVLKGIEKMICVQDIYKYKYILTVLIINYLLNLYMCVLKFSTLSTNM